MSDTSKYGSAKTKPGKQVFSCLEHLLAFYARTTPSQHAIMAPGSICVTYAELWELTKDVIRQLRRFGLKASDRVAVVLPRGAENAVVTIAVATGAVCVPLNPDFTADELERYFSALKIAALLTCGDMNCVSRGVAHTLGIPVICLMPRNGGGLGAFRLVSLAKRRPIAFVAASGAGDDAFILVSSGTTSRPKMVPLTHANVLLSAYNVGAVLALGNWDRLLNVLPLFHAHGLISGLLTALAAGSTAICTPRFDAALFFDWLRELRPSWYTAVPSIHRAILSMANHHKQDVRRSSLRLIRSASAFLPLDVLNGLETLFGVPVIETYGMTEAASQITANPRRRRKMGSVGKPAGPEVAIMDLDGRMLLAGERGEIVLRGPTIMRRYDNDVAATESAFRNGWFRTGDLGYFDSEGYLFIVGRIKEIINRGGQQVSPFEVEEALSKHPSVLEAAAFAIPHEKLGEAVAAVVVLRQNFKISPQKLRHFARKQLAAFKVPAFIRIVPEIPKGASGKIKRSALAHTLSTTSPTADESSSLSLYRSGLETQLAEMWADLLELSEIGIDRDVFELGADSLTLTRMLSRLQERYGADFSFEDFFEAPTIASMANRLQSLKRNRTSVSEFSRSLPDVSVFPMSFQQQRIKVLCNLDPTGYNYNVVDVVRLTGPLDLEALEVGIETICSRHEILRSNFSDREGEPVQILSKVRPRLEYFDLGPFAEHKETAAISRQVRKFACQPIRLENEPPLKAQLFRVGEDDHALVVKVHHVATDGWSQRLFWKEVEILYSAGKSGIVAELPELAFQYRDFSEWQRKWLQSRAAKDQLDYWRTQLEGLTELPLRTDRPRPQIRTGRGARHSFRLSRTLSKDLRSLSRTEGVTLFMTLLGAFQSLLCRYTSHEDVAVGSLIANRNLIQTEQLIGMFANTVVLRTDVSGDPTFREILRRVRKVTLDAYRNQDLPIEKIIQVLQVSRSLNRNPLFQVMFILQNASAEPPVLPGLSAEFIEVDPGIARFDLTLEFAEEGEHLTGSFEYSTDLFNVSTIVRMATHLRVLLAAIVADPNEQISRFPWLSASEQRRFLTDWGERKTNFARLGNFFNWFSRRLDRAPDAMAVSDGQLRLSYRELDRRSIAITQRMTPKGVGPEVVVAILAKRDTDLLAALMAVQRIGGAFVCLEPTLPVARLTQIIQSSRASLLLTGGGVAAVLDGVFSRMPSRERIPILNLQDIGEPQSPVPESPVRSDPSNLAYLVYTSGSTGVPKGVMVEQRGLLNHLISLISELRLSAADVIAQTAPQSFVISVWQFLAGLMVGARIHICTDEIVQDPALLAHEISREGLTVLQIVPSLLREILLRANNERVFRAFGQLRLLISTGEALAASVCRDWFRHFPNVPLINAYGSSECSDDVALHRFTAAPLLPTIPVGRAIPNIRLYVLDSHSQLVPIGVPGELCVGGVGVGRGYLNDPEQTKLKFFRDPFSSRKGSRMYRTGDLARWRADGTLECLGRLDHRVKLRGYRIELKEIEHVLLDHPDVRDATVLHYDETGGEIGLVAYITAVANRRPNVVSLRDFLSARLPVYMIPKYLLFPERMPLTTHGKVDRSMLLAMPRGVATAADVLVAPRRLTEKLLSNIWLELLGIEAVGVFDNFFDLGGHSLLAGQVVSRVAIAFGVSLPVKAVFEAPTIDALSKRIDEAAEKQSYQPVLEIPWLEENAPRSVSIAQEEMMKIERHLPGLPQFNLPFAFRLSGPLDVLALRRSLVEILSRHEALRTRFTWLKKQPVAFVVPTEDISSLLIIENLATKNAKNAKRLSSLQLKKAELLSEQEAWTPCDIAREPLLRMRLLRLASDDFVLLMTVHHMIADGWSIGLLFEEISKLYYAFASGQPANLPEPKLRFSDVARWERSWCTTDSAAHQLAYWSKKLRVASPVFCGEDKGARPNPLIVHEPVRLPEDFVTRLSAYGRVYGGTLFMTLLTGLKAVLAVRTGRTDICVATAMANRSKPGTDRVIGLFQNTTIIRTSVDPNSSFPEVLSQVRNAVLDAHVRQEIPFDVLVERLVKEEGLDLASLVQVYFTLQNPLCRPLELHDVTVKSFGNIYREGQPVMPIDDTWLSLMLKERPLGITGSCIYKNSQFKRVTVTQWLEDFATILRNAIDYPEVPLRDLFDRQILWSAEVGPEAGVSENLSHSRSPPDEWP